MTEQFTNIRGAVARSAGKRAGTWSLARTVVAFTAVGVFAPAVGVFAPALALGQSARLGGNLDRGAVDARAAHVFHLPGIGGERWVDHQWADGLADGGAVAGGRDGVEMFDWIDGRPGLPALVAYDRNRERATQLGRRIADYRAAHPRSPVVVTAHSGGAGIAVWALESLPAGVTIDGLVLIAPALSPGYDLSPALAHVSGHALALTSPLDAVVLGTGTRTFGTIDRVRSDAAGRVGFVTPSDVADVADVAAALADAADPSTRPATRPSSRPTTSPATRPAPPTFADPAQYRKLLAVPYDPAWAALGNRGSHNGAMRREFVRRVVAPMVLDATASSATPATP